jgi:hypothetical protein
LELIEEQDVGFVKCSCHLSEQYFVWRANRKVAGPCLPRWEA